MVASDLVSYQPRFFPANTLARQLLQQQGEEISMDALYLCVTVGFFALTWGLLALCEKV